MRTGFDLGLIKKLENPGEEEGGDVLVTRMRARGQKSARSQRKTERERRLLKTPRGGEGGGGRGGSGIPLHHLTRTGEPDSQAQEKVKTFTLGGVLSFSKCFISQDFETETVTRS